MPTTQTDQPNLCRNCGRVLKFIGHAWCGKKYLPLYACRGKEGCGAYTFYPVHEFQHTLAAIPPPSPGEKHKD